MVDGTVIGTQCGNGMYPHEIEMLYTSASEIKARNIVEIGARSGNSSVALATVAKEQGGHLYSIDPDRKFHEGWEKNLEHFGVREYATKIIKASPWVDKEDIKTPIDYLFIDGNHQTRWVLVDYHYFQPWVRKNGRIAFHDICFASVKPAIEIILSTDGKNIREVCKTEKGKRGVVVWQI